MNRFTATVAGSLVVLGAGLGGAPSSAAATTPLGFNQNMNAADGISALESEGYNVEINWGGGRTDQNLALCRISAVDGLRGSGASRPGTSAYITVVC